MSLDVTLYAPEDTVSECTCTDCGNSHERRYKATLFGRNITHNLGKMADAVGCYKAVWRPEEAGIKTASQVIPFLGVALDALRSGSFEEYEPENKWGTQADFIDFLQAYLEACQAYPDATVSAWR